MKYITLLAAMLFAAPSFGADLDPVILLELAKAKRLRESGPQPVVKSTTCNCAATGKCLCYAGECRCSACGLGTEPSKKASPGMKGIGVRPADTSPLPGKEHGSFDSNPVPSTSTSVPNAYRLGGTEGCANGNCPTSAPATRRGFLIRR